MLSKAVRAFGVMLNKSPSRLSAIGCKWSGPGVACRAPTRLRGFLYCHAYCSGLSVCHGMEETGDVLGVF
jgi:hypothetical protein